MHDRFLRLFAANKGRPRRFDVSAESAGAATVYVYDMIVDTDLEAEWFGGVSPSAFARALADIDAAQIMLRVNSPGGSVFAARAMVQTLRDHPARVTAIVDGLAASAASVLITGADEIQMAEGSMLMIHRAWTWAMGDTGAMLDCAALLEKVDGTIAETYAARAGGDAAHWLELMDAETWFTAGEAIDAKLADAMAPGAKAAQNTWDLAAFARAPAGLSARRAPAPPSGKAPDTHQRAALLRRLEFAARR